MRGVVIAPVLAAALAACSAGEVASAESADVTACTSHVRDWQASPAVLVRDAGPELWALSDVHGDYQALLRLLGTAGLVHGTAPVWTGGNADLVIVGDLIDKGPDAVEVVRFVASLARSSGGHVTVTMGNHEAEFFADPNNGKASGSDGLDPQLAASGLTPAATAAGTNDIGAFLRALPVAARVGDWFFAHAGKTDGRTVAALEHDVACGVEASGFGAPALSDPASLLEARLGGHGPQWWDVDGDPKATLGRWTTALGAHHIVMGHQPGSVGFADGTKRPSDAMYSAFGGLLYLVDTGLSSGVDRTGGALLHVTAPGTAGEHVEEVLPDGTRRPL